MEEIRRNYPEIRTRISSLLTETVDGIDKVIGLVPNSPSEKSFTCPAKTKSSIMTIT